MWVNSPPTCPKVHPHPHLPPMQIILFRSPKARMSRLKMVKRKTYRNTRGDCRTTPDHPLSRTDLSLSTKHPPDIPFLMRSTVSPGLGTTTAGWRDSRWWRTSWWSHSWSLYSLLSSFTFQQSRGMIGGAGSISAYKVAGGDSHSLTSSRQSSRQSSSLMSSSLPSGQSSVSHPQTSDLTHNLTLQLRLFTGGQQWVGFT